MSNQSTGANKLAGAIVSIFTLWLLAAASSEVYEAGYGSGNWIGRFSLKWVLTIAGFELLFILILGVVGVALWRPERLNKIKVILLSLRQRYGRIWWIFSSTFIFSLAWLFMFTSLGNIFDGVYVRFVLFTATVCVVAWTITSSETKLVEWSQLLASFILVGSVFAFGKLLAQVTDYPFTLYWSEGNRWWDYSLAYRPDLYVYPGGDLAKEINYPGGRIVLYGLPYLLPNFSIWGLRLWNALLFSIPYAVFGWVAISVRGTKVAPKIIFALWAFIFLNQGPIWAPLVIVAALVALVRRSSLWVATPVLMLAGYYAAFSRPTWVFAPSIWIIMLVFAQPILEKRGLHIRDWVRASVLGIAGIVGSFLIIRVFPRLNELNVVGIAKDGGEGTIVSEFFDTVVKLLTQHSLEWSRLFPNPTFGPGILLALVLACLPLILVLVHFVRSSRLRLNTWQKLTLGGGMISFLLVGLVASVKVGGGTNLHNLDMFFVGMVFMTTIAWLAGIDIEIGTLMQRSGAMRGIMILIVAIPAFMPMVGATPLELPPVEEVEIALWRIQEYVSCAQEYGEVLFMDQRQLLTFGYVENVILVPEYEKKVVMDQALGENENYFEEFYDDLATSRFSLIIAERQFVQIKDSSESLAEENNAWVLWVSIPLLQEYEPVESHKSVKVDLFMPIGRNYQCP